MKASLVLSLLLMGCAADGASVPKTDAADAHRRLERTRTEHTALLEQLANAPAAQLESCRATSGDCLLQVAESRGRLVSGLRLDPCTSAETPEKKSGCVTAQLEGAGHDRELTDYYSLESWCFKQLTRCTQHQAEAARTAALDARFVIRKSELERKPEAVTARGAVQLAHARIEYLRATLPPNTDVCAPEPSVESCKTRAEAARKSVDERLRQDSLDDAAALQSYVAAQNDEASCSQPEIECLSGALASYGVFPESRKYVDRNLALLSERQGLLGQVSEEAGQHCLASSQKQHQGDIVAAYVAYAREQVLYFRMQLDKSFLDLHQDEVTCLRAGRKTAPATQAVATKR